MAFFFIAEKFYYLSTPQPIYATTPKKTTDTVSRIEQKTLIPIADFKKFIETGIQQKLIKIVEQGVREVILGQNNLIIQAPDVVLRDSGGNVIEKRSSHVFSVAPRILGEKNKLYVSFDPIFKRNKLDPVQAQNHDSWSRLNLSVTQRTVAFNAVMNAGGRDDPWDVKKSKYYGLGIYFEK